MSLSTTYGLRLLTQPRVRLAILAVLTVVILGYRVVQFVYWTGQPQWAYDFSFYWTAAAHLLHGEPIYSAAQLAGPYVPQAQEGFLYPPALAAFVTPLAALFPHDPRAANWIWSGLGAAILVASVLALVRSEKLDECFRFLGGRGRWWLVAGAFAFPPVVDELVVGNVHLLLVGLLTAAWLGVRRAQAGVMSGGVMSGDRASGDRLAGIGVGAAGIVKIFPGLLMLWFVLTKRWRAAAWAIAAALAIAVASLPITGLQPWLDYPTVLANLSSTPAATDALAPTFWLAPYLGFTVARVLVTVVGIAILAWTSLRAPRDMDGTRLTFAIAVTLSVLMTPALYTSYLTVLVLPLILAFAAGVPRGWLALAYLLMWGGQQPALGDLEWIVTRALPTAGALLLLALLLREVLGNHVPRYREGADDGLGHDGECDHEPAGAVVR
jgi:hypothetical protein